MATEIHVRMRIDDGNLVDDIYEDVSYAVAEVAKVHDFDFHMTQIEVT